MDEDELMAGSVGPAERRSNRSHIASSKRELTKDKRDAVVTSNEHASTKSAAAKRRAEDSLEAMSDVNKLAWGFHQRERSAIKRVAAQYESDAERPFFNVNSKELPPKMKELLKKDMEMSLAGKTLPKLPARSSISKILNEFAKYMQRLNDVCGIPNRRVSVTWKATAASLNECVDGLKDLFDVIVAHQLLTEKELCRHEELLQWGIIRRRRARRSGQSEFYVTYSCEELAPLCNSEVHLSQFMVHEAAAVKFVGYNRSIGTVDGVVLEALKGFSNCLNLYLVNHAEELFDIAEDYAPIVAQ
ncbi:unnamed protein product [Toxocara canis]|uniref:MRG domain-containing protein n=1 Tax=Toxocara canis TaxID=6265 RepID=A0A183V0B1_TOXCA|nr:unnamed protein product [Toxocara canis]